MRLARAARLLVFVAVLTLFPAAHAGQVPLHDFEGTLEAPVLGSQVDADKARFAVVTGAVSVAGTGSGLLAVVGTDGVAVDDVPRVEVFDTTGGLDAIDPEEFRRTGRPIHRAFENARLTFPDNVTIFYSSNGFDQNLAVEAPFALGVPIDPADNLGGSTVKVTVNQSLALIGPVGFTSELSATAEDAFVYAENESVAVTITSEDEPTGESFPGKTYVFRLVGGARLSGAGDTLLLPLEGTIVARFEPGPLASVRERFDPGRVQSELQRLTPGEQQGERFQLTDEAVTILKSVAPVFNGALMGNPVGEAAIAGHEAEALGDFTFYRFDQLTLSEGETSGQVAYGGQGRLLMVQDELYTEKSAFGPDLFPIPLLALFLWVLAAAGLILGFVLRPFFPPSPANAAFPVRITGTVVHVAGILLGYILWDLEIKLFLGTSLLTMIFGGGPTDGVALAAIASLELFSFGLAWFLFGLPIQFVVNSVLKLSSLKKGRGVGRGLSYVSAWGLGAAFLPVFLSPVIGLLVDKLGA